MKYLELEALRGLAALYVFCHHTVFTFFSIEKSSTIGFFFRFGQEAVMLFFILSGFVIALSMNKNNYSFKKYFKHRFLRIYSIVIFAWILSAFSFYLINDEIFINSYDILMNILMLQDISSLKPGVIASPLYNNSPLWSLSYEWWFYMIFFVHYIFIYNKSNIFNMNHIALGISMFGLFSYNIFYNQLSLFLIYYYIWFSGAFTFFFVHNISKKYLLTIIYSYLIIIGTYYYLFIHNSIINGLGDFPLLIIRHYIFSFLLLSLSLFYYFYINNKIYSNFIYQKFIRFFSLIGAISFSIYIFHVPIKGIVIHCFNNENGYTLILITLLLTIFLAYIVEIKIYKKIIQLLHKDKT